MIKIHSAFQLITKTKQQKDTATDLSIIESKPYEYIKNGISLFKLSNYNLIWGNLDWFNESSMLSKLIDKENYYQDPHKILFKIEYPKGFQRIGTTTLQHNIGELNNQLNEIRKFKRNSEDERAILTKIREYTSNLLNNTSKQREDIEFPYLIKYRTNKNLEAVFELIANSIPLKVIRFIIRLKTLMKDVQKLDELNFSNMEKDIEKIKHLKMEIEKLVLIALDANKSLLKSTYISNIEERVRELQDSMKIKEEFGSIYEFKAITLLNNIILNTKENLGIEYMTFPKRIMILISKNYKLELQKFIKLISKIINEQIDELLKKIKRCNEFERERNFQDKKDFTDIEYFMNSGYSSIETSVNLESEAEPEQDSKNEETLIKLRISISQIKTRLNKLKDEIIGAEIFNSRNFTSSEENQEWDNNISNLEIIFPNSITIDTKIHPISEDKIYKCIFLNEPYNWILKIAAHHEKRRVLYQNLFECIQNKTNLKEILTPFIETYDLLALEEELEAGAVKYHKTNVDILAKWGLRCRTRIPLIEKFKDMIDLDRIKDRKIIIENPEFSWPLIFHENIEEIIDKNEKTEGKIMKRKDYNYNSICEANPTECIKIIKRFDKEIETHKELSQALFYCINITYFATLKATSNLSQDGWKNRCDMCREVKDPSADMRICSIAPMSDMGKKCALCYLLSKDLTIENYLEGNVLISQNHFHSQRTCGVVKKCLDKIMSQTMIAGISNGHIISGDIDLECFWNSMNYSLEEKGLYNCLNMNEFGHLEIKMSQIYLFVLLNIIEIGTFKSTESIIQVFDCIIITVNAVLKIYSLGIQFNPHSSYLSWIRNAKNKTVNLQNPLKAIILEEETNYVNEEISQILKELSSDYIKESFSKEEMEELTDKIERENIEKEIGCEKNIKKYTCKIYAGDEWRFFHINSSIRILLRTMIVKFQSREKLEEKILASMIKLGYSIGIEAIVSAYFPTPSKAKEWYSVDYNLVSLSMLKVMSCEKNIRKIGLIRQAKVLWSFLLNIEEFNLSQITHLKDNHVESFIRETCLFAVPEDYVYILKMLSVKGLFKEQNNFTVRDTSNINDVITEINLQTANKIVNKIRQDEVLKNNTEFKESIVIKKLNRMNEMGRIEYMKGN